MSLAPRPYQQKAIDSILAKFEAGEQRTLITCPTGTGKTVIAAHVGHRFLDAGRGRVMILAHRDELIRQAAAKFRDVTGEEPAVEKAMEQSDENGLRKPPIVVSSFQTQNAGKGERKRMERFDPKEFAFLWVDEAHHIVAPSFLAVLDYYARGNPDLKVLGVTATADRADGEELGQVFQSCAFRYEIHDAIADGWLVNVVQRAVVIEDLDFSRVRTTAGDFNSADMEAVMMAEKPLHGIVQATLEAAYQLPRGSLDALRDRPDRQDLLKALVAGRRPKRTLIFAVSIAHADRLSEILNRWVENSAKHVDGTMPMDDRRGRLEEFSHGAFAFLANCMVCTEGYDEPGIELVVMGRLTKSRALYAQMIGRGTRPLASIAEPLGGLATDVERREMIGASDKPHVTVLDFVGNAGRHQLISAADVLGDSRFDPSVVQRAKEIAQAEDVDVFEALDVAQEEQELDEHRLCVLAEAQQEANDDEDERVRAADAERRTQVVATASRYTVQTVDPFGGDGQRPTVAAEPSSGGATDKQVAALEGMGVSHEQAVKYGVRQAGAVLTSLRAKHCSGGQARWLRANGYGEHEIAAMNFQAASETIDRIKRGERAPA